MSYPALRGLQLLVATAVFSLATAITASAATRLAPIKQVSGETILMFDAYLETSVPCNQHQSNVELNISQNDILSTETLIPELVKQGSTTALNTPVTHATLPGDALRGVLERTSHAQTVSLPDDLFSAAIKYHGDPDIYSGINAMKCPEADEDNLRQTALDIPSGPSTARTTDILCPNRGAILSPSIN